MSRIVPNKSLIQFIDFEIMLLNDYIDYVEDYFEAKETDIQKRFDELNKIPKNDEIHQTLDDYHQSWYEVLIDGLIDDAFYKDEFSQKFRESLVIQIHSFMEKYLSRVKKHFLEKNDLKENKMGKKNYTEKLAIILAPQIKIENIKGYKFLVRFTELRNCIIHNEGKIKSTTTFPERLKALKQLKKEKHINLKERKNPKSITYDIKINDKKFLKFSLIIISNFLKDLDKKLLKHY